MEKDKFLQIHIVQKRLSCARSQIYKLIHDGGLDAIRIGKRGLRISENSYNDFILRNKVNPEDINGCW